MNEPSSQADQQLLELVRRKPPEDLTPEEIKRLQQRMQESPELREAMAGQLRMEEYLAAALGAVNLPVEDMIRRSGRSRSFSSYLASPLVALVVVLVLVGVFAWVFISRSGPGPVAQQDTTEQSPAEEEDSSEDTSQDSERDSAPQENETQPSAGTGSEQELPDPENTADPEQDTGEEETDPLAVAVEDDPAVPPQDFRLVIEAEDFVRGNLLRDEGEFGTAECVIARTDQAAPTPSFAEYEFEIATAGQYELAVRYASFDSRPLQLIVNGQESPIALAEEPTGGWHEPDQRWRMQSLVDLEQGQNVFRLEALTQFPNFDKLSIAAIPSPSEGSPSIVASPTHRTQPWLEDLAAAPRSYEDVWFRDLTPGIHPLKIEQVGAWFDDANLPVLALMAERRGLLTSWEDELNGQRVLTPVRIQGPPPVADRSVEFTQLEDGSYLVTGASPDKGTYTLWFEEDLTGVESITLEAIGHEWLPNGGPGLSAGSGLLTRLHLYQGPEAALTAEGSEAEAAAAEYRLPISQAEASHSLNGYPIADCLDDRTNTGWGLDPNHGADHRAVFTLEAPLGDTSSGWLRLDMHQDFGAEQMIGRFRILVPTGQQPEVPPEVRAVLNVMPSNRSPEQVQVLVDYLAPRDPRLEVLTEQITQLSGEGSALNWELGDSPKGNSPRLQGIGRLRSPWFEDAVLRLEMLDYPGLKIHFFHGEEGATLVNLGHGQLQWAGYKTERHAGQSIPYHYELTANDQYRNWRSGGIAGGPIDLRYNQGEIILSRADIELMRVPMPGEPEEVYLEGSTTIAGINMYRAADLPLAPQTTEPETFARPAEMEWELSRLAEGVEVQRPEDGSLVLAGDDVAGDFTITAPIPMLLPSEIVLEVSGVSPGMSLFVTQGTQVPDAIFNIVQEPGGGRQFALVHPPGSTRREDAPPDVGRQFAPYVGERFWVKFALAGTATRCWISADGIHWGEWLFPPTRNLRPIDTVGIYYGGGGGEVALTLNRIELRPIAGLTELVDAELLERANAERGSDDFETWLAAVDEECPDDVEPSLWRKARALRILAVSTSPQQTHKLFDYLLESAIEEGQPIETQLGILHAASLIAPPISNPEEALVYYNKYVALGYRAHALGEERPYTFIRRPLMSDPFIYTPSISLGEERLQNWELIYPIYAGNWQQVSNTVRGWTFLDVDRGTNLTEWAVAKANEHLSGGAGGLASFLPQQWLPPVSPEIDKSLYNQVVELETTVDSDAIEDACNLIRRLKPGASSGLAPTRTDPQLHLSLQAAIALTMSRRPEVREAIQAQFEDIAELRVQAAARNGDFETLRLASLQFYGTQAALEASMRLGDRALSAGEFERALGLYREAAEQAGQPLLNEVAPRIRLAAAFIGENAGEPVVGRVTMGEASYSAEEFESLVAEMLIRSRDQSIGYADSPAWRPAGPAPAPTAYTLLQRGVFDGDSGANIPNFSVPLGNELQLPWVERQMATAVHENVLYVNNRYQVAAYNLEDGARLWKNAMPFGNHQFDQRPFTPMRPVFIQDQVICRMLTGPTLIGIRKENGQRIWDSNTGGRPICSDPVIWHDKLYALTRFTDPQRPQRCTLRLEIYNPSTGELFESVDLIAGWQSSYISEVAQLALCGNRLVVSYEGATICLNEEGRVLWLRQHTTMPESLERYWVLQDQHPVLYENGLLYAALPGMRKIECMELESGRSHWRAVVADLRGIVGLVEGVLLARTETGFVGFSAETGELVWRTDVEELCEGVLAGGPGGLLCARRASRPGESNLWPQLVWLDPQTGEERASFTLETLPGLDPQVGPFVNTGDKFLLFYSPSPTTIERQIYELTPDPAVELAERP